MARTGRHTQAELALGPTQEVEFDTSGIGLSSSLLAGIDVEALQDAADEDQHRMNLQGKFGKGKGTQQRFSRSNSIQSFIP